MKNRVTKLNNSKIELSNGVTFVLILLNWTTGSDLKNKCSNDR